MPDKDDNIEYNRDLPYADEKVSKDPNFGLEGIDEIDFEEQDITKIATFTRWEKLKGWFRRTWNGNNKEGKYLGLGLDVGESFLPDVVSRIRDIIQNKTQPKTDTDMKFLQELKRRLKQPSGKAVLTVIAVVAAYFGADINAEELGETLVTIIQGLSAVVAGAVALYEMFRDEDKAK